MSVDCTAILCYGYKLTREEVERIGIEKIYEVKEKYEKLPTPIGIIRETDYSDKTDWYVGRWMESSSSTYRAEDLVVVEQYYFAKIAHIMDELFDTLGYWSQREEKQPEWHLFVRHY